jgi:hypothetical protein
VVRAGLEFRDQRFRVKYGIEPILGLATVSYITPIPLNTEPYTLHLNPEPEPRNPKPETLNQVHIVLLNVRHVENPLVGLTGLRFVLFPEP